MSQVQGIRALLGLHFPAPTLHHRSRNYCASLRDHAIPSGQTMFGQLSTDRRHNDDSGVCTNHTRAGPVKLKLKLKQWSRYGVAASGLLS
jgi:hypothetical protein